MKLGLRTPSLKKRIAARVSIKRMVRHDLGLKAPRGYGILTNPKKAIYNYGYNRTSFSIDRLFKSKRRKSKERNISFIGAVLILFLVGAIYNLFVENWLIITSICIGVLFVWLHIKRRERKNDPVNIALDLLKQNEVDKAINYLNEQVISDGENYLLIDLLASMYAGNNDLKKSIKYFNLLLSKPLDHEFREQTLNKLCAVYLNENGEENAEMLFNSVAYRKRNLSSNMLNMALNLGNYFASQNNIKKSVKYFEKITKSKLPVENSPANSLDNLTIQQKALQQLEHV